jgi:hypothetical protein
MKTAMQELMDYLDDTLPKSIKEQYLEKEKEQIIEASNNVALKSMVHREKLDTMSEDELRDSLVEDTISYGEEYYNQTYNQKQHIIDIMKADEDDGLYDQNK